VLKDAIKIVVIMVVLAMPSFAQADIEVSYDIDATYEGIPVDDTGKVVTVVAGLDVAKSGYTKVLRYALTEGRYLYFVATKKAGKGEELAFVEHDFETGEQIVIWTSPRAEGPGKSGIYSPNFMINNESHIYALLMYADEVFTDKYYTATTHVKVFKKDRNAGVYNPFGARVVGESSVLLEKKKDMKYRYLAVSGDINTPAIIVEPKIVVLYFQSSSKLFLGSSLDIVIWQKVYTSRRANEKGSDFVLSEEKFSSMYKPHSERGFTEYRDIEVDDTFKEDLLMEIDRSMRPKDVDIYLW